MAYSTNPNLPRARALAMKLFVLERLPLQVVANRSGVHRSTIWRWKQKWNILNDHVQLTNDNRPRRADMRTVSAFRFSSCKWLIPTLASRPQHSPRAIDGKTVARILELRKQLQRLC